MKLVTALEFKKHMVRIFILPGEMTRKLKIPPGWFGWWWWSEDEEEEAHGAELFEWTVVGLKVKDLPGKMWRLGERDTATPAPMSSNRFLKPLHRRILDHQAPQATTFGKHVTQLQ